MKTNASTLLKIIAIFSVAYCASLPAMQQGYNPANAVYLRRVVNWSNIPADFRILNQDYYTSSLSRTIDPGNTLSLNRTVYPIHEDVSITLGPLFSVVPSTWSGLLIAPERQAEWTLGVLQGQALLNYQGQPWSEKIPAGQPFDIVIHSKSSVRLVPVAPAAAPQIPVQPAGIPVLQEEAFEETAPERQTGPLQPGGSGRRRSK